MKGKCQAYINYANGTLAGIIQHLYDDIGTISPIDIKENEQKIKIMVAPRPNGGPI